MNPQRSTAEIQEETTKQGWAYLSVLLLKVPICAHPYVFSENRGSRSMH